MHTFELTPGTINTWIFVNGELTEEAFIQSIMTATEAKVKVMNDPKGNRQSHGNDCDRNFNR